MFHHDTSLVYSFLERSRLVRIRSTKGIPDGGGMIAPESYGIIETDPEQFRATILDNTKGNCVRFFWNRFTRHDGTYAGNRRNPHANPLHEILSAPMALARTNIWWLHTILALIDTCVPFGSGVGPLYEQLLWLCLTDTALDKELQMRYCAKMIATLGCTSSEPLCGACMHELQVALTNLVLSLDSYSCALLKGWMAHSKNI